MPRLRTCASIAVALLCTTACTQEPAAISLNGHKGFGRSGVSIASGAKMYGYTKTASIAGPSYVSKPDKPIVVSQHTQAAAATESISVSELSPPEPAPSKEEKKMASAHSVNPWTGKERKTYVEETPVIRAETARAKPVRLSIDAPPAAKAGLIWPVNGSKVISTYGPKGNGKANDGINIAAAEGEPVWAAAEGEVVYVGNELAGYGNMVIIKHPSNKTTTYAHLSRSAVDKYDRVKQGDIIGYVGSTGNVKSAQLHFAVRDGKDVVDPMKHVSRSVAGL